MNRSNTALTLQRFGALYPETPGLVGTLADYGADIAAAKLGPVGYAAKKIGSAIVKSAKDKKAVEAELGADWVAANSKSTASVVLTVNVIKAALAKSA